MSKYCPNVNGTVTYLTCLDCEDRVCLKAKVSKQSETLFDILRKIRIVNGEVLLDMAKKLGCSPAELSGAEHGRHPFPSEWIEKLERLYNLNPDIVAKIKTLAGV